ncbi:MAG: DUF1028 domain-containing protein [Actinobacteria bacterium]|nr:DUF1028 domain-containing protein [Actinomycetota bacterium]
MTFSIVAWDPAPSPPEWGVAVASKFLAVGSAVPWAQAGTGAVATQALANLAYGPDGLALLASGASAQDAVEQLTGADEDSAQRQLGVVDAKGRAASFTGSDCFDWAGGVTGDGYCCQGNILTGPEVVEVMASTFTESEGDLAARLLAALEAGDRAGGDSRGRQSAALYVVREGGGYGGGIDRYVDLRVEDHGAPIDELKRLFTMHKLLFPRPEDLNFIAVDEALAAELRTLLSAAGYEPGSGVGYDGALRGALYEYCGTENLEERWSEEAKIEQEVLTFLRQNQPPTGVTFPT